MTFPKRGEAAAPNHAATSTTGDATTLERLIPDDLDPGNATGLSTLALHVERYRFAARAITRGRVLDIACGAGYGTRILADACPEVAEVIGVDISPAAIEYAASRYGGRRIRFVQDDGVRYRDPCGFDAIVSLETIEHVPDPAAFLANVLRSLKAGGTLIGSVPITPSVDANPYHLTDFTRRSFRRLLARFGLVEVDAFEQVQPYNLVAILKRQERRLSDLRPNLLGHYARHPERLVGRLVSTVLHGFNNKYLTVVATKP